MRYLIDSNFGVEGFLLPTTRIKCAVNFAGNVRRLVSARFENGTAQQAKLTERFENISPFFRIDGRKNRDAVPPLLDVVTLRNVVRHKGTIRHPESMMPRPPKIYASACRGSKSLITQAR